MDVSLNWGAAPVKHQERINFEKVDPLLMFYRGQLRFYLTLTP